MATSADDIEFVLSEVARIARSNQHKGAKPSFPEWFATLPHPSGSGEMRCGIAAYERLQNRAAFALSGCGHAGRIDLAAVFQELKSIVVQRFIREGREVNIREADRAVSAAIKAVAKNRTDLTHFVPCHLGHATTPEEFSIGPVRFGQRSRVLERLEPALRAYVDQDLCTRSNVDESGDRREIREMLLHDAREYCASFGWIAEVTIECCDARTSKKRAVLIVQSALDCLHLLVGEAYSNHMRMGGQSFNIDRRCHIATSADGAAEISGSVEWLSHNLGEGWWERLNSNTGDQFIALMGVAIENGHDISRPSPLAQRFLNGVAWYGEAVRDQFEASRLVKYVTAIEHIVMTRNEKNLSMTLAARGAALALDPKSNSLEELRKRFLKVYDLRSRLVHGSRSPSDTRLRPGIRDAEELARSVLFGALQLFRREGLEDRRVNNQKLESAYGRLLEWAQAATQSS